MFVKSAVIALILGLGLLLAGCTTFSRAYYSTPEGVAIQGYDTVAYFTAGQAIPGRAEYSYDWQGVIWQFSSEEHRQLFSADPPSYAPQYGGYCAWAAARDRLVKIDPEVWAIVDGKLYLNYDMKIQLKWEANRAADIEEADDNWPALSQNLSR
jgi:YHS domain-containing protein